MLAYTDAYSASSNLPDEPFREIDSAGRLPKGFAAPPELFKGVPDDACHCPHIGYVTKGVIGYTFIDGTTETVRAGDVYYIRPGHHVECSEDSEAVDSNATKQSREVIEVFSRNMQTAD